MILLVKKLGNWKYAILQGDALLWNVLYWFNEKFNKRRHSVSEFDAAPETRFLCLSYMQEWHALRNSPLMQEWTCALNVWPHQTQNYIFRLLSCQYLSKEWFFLIMFSILNNFKWTCSEFEIVKQTFCLSTHCFKVKTSNQL